LIAIAVASFNASPRLLASHVAAARSDVVLQTTTALPLSGTFQTVNNLFGDQADTHIDCELASYTSHDFLGSSEIRYFDFATNTELAIPGNGTSTLSDVSSKHISFLESTIDGPHIIIFDTVSQTRTVVPGFGHLRSSLGGNLLAFEQRTFTPHSPDWATTEAEIGLYQLGTGTVTSLTDDSLFDRHLNVSPNGNAVVWSKCQTNQSGCDVYAAIQTASGVFTTQALTSTPDEESFPRTNGELVVYLSTRDGETDIYYQPVVGGAETRILIPGEQRSPSISGNLISFESPDDQNGSWDIFVYDINTGNIYRATNTLVEEVLSDISVCNGVARIVWASAASDFDVFAFTFQPPSPTESQIEDLIKLVESFDLPQGSENSLVAKLQDALAAVEASQTARACDCLSDFINECAAQSGKKLTADQASQLINSATRIETDLGCQ
jgi:hypothetical protein